jgi:hypothetical protein
VGELDSRTDRRGCNSASKAQLALLSRRNVRPTRQLADAPAYIPWMRGHLPARLPVLLSAISLYNRGRSAILICVLGDCLMNGVRHRAGGGADRC